MRACDYNVYRVKYKTREQIRKTDWSGMDSDFVGWKEGVPKEYLCVAPDLSLARAIFTFRHSHDEHVRDVEIEHVGQLDDLVYLQ